MYIILRWWVKVVQRSNKTHLQDTIRKCEDLGHWSSSCIFLPISQQIAALILDSTSRTAVDLSFHKMSYLQSAYSWLPPSGCPATNSQPGIPKSSMAFWIFTALWMFQDLLGQTLKPRSNNNRCPASFSLPSLSLSSKSQVYNGGFTQFTMQRPRKKKMVRFTSRAV